MSEILNHAKFDKMVDPRSLKDHPKNRNTHSIEQITRLATIIWNKDRMTLGRGKYQNKYEPCWFGWNDSGAGFVCEDRSITNVWDLKRPSVNDLHPTMKPVELCTTAIGHASKPGGKVLDIFGGSGSTLIACEKTHRKCFMMEIDPHYVDIIIIARWEKYTGNKAVKQD